MSVDSISERDKTIKKVIGGAITLVVKTTGKQATITSRTSMGLYYIDTTTGKKYYTTFDQNGTLSDTSNEVPAKGGAWTKVPTPVTIGVLQPITTPSTPSDQRFVRPSHPSSQVKLASSKIMLTQSLLRLCEDKKEFSMAKSGESELILEEKVTPQKFLGITVGGSKKGYRARILLDDSEKEVKYQEIEDRPRSVGVIPSGKGGFGIKPQASGKVQENPMADRMRGSIRQVVESAGWRLSYAS